MKKNLLLGVMLVVGILIGSFTLGPVISQVVNSLVLVPASTGGEPSLSASGSDTNIDVALRPKGTGMVGPSGLTGLGAKLGGKNASAPSVQSCGSGTVTGSDIGGKITLAGGANSCIVNFGSAWAREPFCTIALSNITNQQNATIPRLSFVGTASFRVASATSGDEFNYICVGRYE